MINHIKGLNAEMAQLIERLKKGEPEISPDTASEINKAASNMIRACQVQVNYALARGDKPKIGFLDQED